jgi:hypothetical protein
MTTAFSALSDVPDPKTDVSGAILPFYHIL